VGLPGEEITFKEGCVCVNGQKLEEPYLDQQGVTKGYKQSVYQVPEGCVLLLGDNRGSSKDSRYWEEPYISIDNIRARVMVCVPLTRWHNIPLPQFGRIHLVG
jgi:signal peptidase I